jgi:Rps23 Pro-64 3,4-dihydroxylase Tpa1-like proline 4-hydroxylase
MNVTVIDDFVDEEYHLQLLKLLSGHQFNWTYLDDISYNIDGKRSDELSSYGLVNMLYCVPTNYISPQYAFIDPLVKSALHQSGCERIHRVRAAMSLYTNPKFLHQRHIDFESKHIAAVYYVNESDGETVIYKDNGNDILQSVEPKANRIVIFEGNLWHTHYSPNKHKNRIILNFNFI